MTSIFPEEKSEKLIWHPKKFFSWPNFKGICLFCFLLVTNMEICTVPLKSTSPSWCVPTSRVFLASKNSNLHHFDIFFLMLFHFCYFPNPPLPKSIEDFLMCLFYRVTSPSSSISPVVWVLISSPPLHCAIPTGLPVSLPPYSVPPLKSISQFLLLSITQTFEGLTVVVFPIFHLENPYPISKVYALSDAIL